MSTMKLICLLFFLCALSQTFANDLRSALKIQCPPCDRIICTPRNANKLKCEGGITRGVCNCCPKCARLDGQVCGGYMEYMGKCDEGLYCDITLDNQNIADGFSHERELEGICKRVPATPPNYIEDTMQGDQPSPDVDTVKCRPECSAELCEKNPRAVCSARSNAHYMATCQEPCQHTSCRACRYVDQDSICTKCAQDDIKCIKTFGRCKKQQSRRNKKVACPADQVKKTLNKKRVFKCEVPECL